MSYSDNKKAKPEKIETPKYTILQRSDEVAL